MKKDEYSFLELFGNIEDEYIAQALQPWKGQARKGTLYHVGRKAACLALIVMLGACLVFHEQVYAAISRFTTMIAEMLQITNDLAPYTDVINTTQEKNGVSLTLNEVILTDHSLLASVKLDAEEEYDGIGISAGENITINGKDYACDSSSVYQMQKLEEDDSRYVVEWLFDGGVPLSKKADMEIGIAVHKQINDIEGETFTFAFSASKEELQKNTAYLMPDQRISLGQGEAVVREFSINSVASRLKLECDIFSPEKEQYFVEMTDMRGNKFSYSLVKKEGEQFTFQNDGALPALDSEWLDVQIYALPYDEENGEAIDFGTMKGEVSEIFRVDSTEMQPVGQTFRLILKEKNE